MGHLAAAATRMNDGICNCFIRAHQPFPGFFPTFSEMGRNAGTMAAATTPRLQFFCWSRVLDNKSVCVLDFGSNSCAGSPKSDPSPEA
jgi:hypothetical protein